MSLVQAEASFDKAKDCAKNKTKQGDCSDRSIEERAFALLALSDDSGIKSDCKSALKDKSEDSKCWPKGNCRLKETSLALLALDHIGEDTSQIENWLLSQNMTPKDLIWYLQIDSTNETTTCKISYSSKNYTLSIDKDKKISPGAGSCLSVAHYGYWLQISNENNCINNVYNVVCDSDFITTLIYNKMNSNVIHVSSQTKTASANGMTENQLSSACFKQGDNCNYEGSLWSTFALSKVGKEVSSFEPYLIAMSSDNTKYLPDSFIYALTNDDEFYSNLVSIQKSAGSWKQSDQGEYYDTAVALLSLSASSEEPTEKAKTFLLETQESNGCWKNSLRDTAFILYALTPSAPAPGPAPIDYCEDYEHSCEMPAKCLDAGGEILNNYQCISPSTVCCSIDAKEKTCDDQDGTICEDDEKCSGESVSHSGSGTCCVGKCEKPVSLETECEKANYDCKSECSSDEEEKTEYSCGDSLDNVCCTAKAPSPSRWYIWLLLILVVLVVLGIIFRNKLRAFIDKFKKGKSSASSSRQFPPTYPSSRQMPIQRQNPRFQQSYQRPQAIPRPSQKSSDKDLDDTMARLRKMSR